MQMYLNTSKALFLLEIVRHCSIVVIRNIIIKHNTFGDENCKCNGMTVISTDLNALSTLAYNYGLSIN